MSTTIVASPLGRQLANTGEVINLEVYVRDEDFVGTYDRLELHRSISGPSGPYEERTGEAYKTGRVPRGAADEGAPETGADANIVGDTIELLVNETQEVVVTFTGVDPISYLVAAGQVTAQGLGLVSGYVIDDFFVVQTVGAGALNSVRVTGGSASSLLRLPTNDPDNIGAGKDIRVSLIAGQSRYSFTDHYGAEDYHYKTRFRNSSTGAVSEFSQAFTVGSRVGVLPTDLAIGEIDLVKLDGKPLINQEVRAHVKFTGAITNNHLLAGGDVVRTTDAHGHVEFPLVRGQKVTVSIPGSSLFRTITVPVDPSVERFQLWDPAIGDDDLFKVKVPDIIVAERRSL